MMCERLSPLRVLLVDDHDLVRSTLATVLAEHGDIEVVGEAATAADGVVEALRLRPSVVLMDVRLPDGSGIDACRLIRASAPEVQVLMLTSYDEPNTRQVAMAGGAAGLRLKDFDLCGLRRAVLALRERAAATMQDAGDRADV